MSIESIFDAIISLTILAMLALPALIIGVIVEKHNTK